MEGCVWTFQAQRNDYYKTEDLHGPGICAGSWRALRWGHWHEKRPRFTTPRLGSSRGDGLAPSSSGRCASTPCSPSFLPELLPPSVLFCDPSPPPPSPSALSSPTPQPCRRPCLHGASRGSKLRSGGEPCAPRGRGLGCPPAPAQTGSRGHKDRCIPRKG